MFWKIQNLKSMQGIVNLLAKSENMNELNKARYH
jgi:hypothetical protein